MSRLAAFLDPGRDLAATLRQTGLADVLGYEAIYDNHILGRDGLSTLAHYGTVTNHARLGTGVYPAFLMSPVALAQRAATLDEVLDGRLTLGIGTSHREVIEGMHGLDFPASPLTAMREIITILRALFTDGAVDFEGEHYTARFTFRGFTPRPDIRIEVAALGPRMLQLAGELADGVLLWLCDDRYIREIALPNIREGAERAGRDPDAIDVIPAVTCALVDDDPAGAESAFRRSLVTYLSLPFYRSMLVDSGYGTVLGQFDAAMGAADFEGAMAAMPREMIDTLGCIGTAEDVRRTLERYRDAGATLPAIGPLTAAGTQSADQVLVAAMGKESRAA
ncbi:MAG TPA: LLM class flavin-dependent oxidoreductase [Nitriliruptorales bacterium]